MLPAERSSDSGVISQPSPRSCTRAEFGQAIAVLTSAKRTSDFTQEQLRVWYAFLAGYRAATIRRAVETLVVTETRFPELSELFKLCRRIEPPDVPYGPNGTGDLRPAYEVELQAIADRIGWDIARVEAVSIGAPVTGARDSLESTLGPQLDALSEDELEGLAARRLSPEAQRWLRQHGISRGTRALLLKALEEEQREVRR